MKARDRTLGVIDRDANPGRDGPASLGWSVAAGALALIAYLWLAPSVAGSGDSTELTIALARNGVPHPTGYPLYTLLGHLFVVLLHRLGAGWDYAANAWSALGGGIAIGLMHALGRRLVPLGSLGSDRSRNLAALVPVALFALNPAWTDVTTLAEVYSWQLAWVMGAALVFVGLMRSITDEASVERGGEATLAWLRVRAAGWGLLCGLGLSHHATSVLVAGPLSLGLLLSLASRRRLGLGLVALALLGALLPLSSYLSLLVKAAHPGAGVWTRLEPTWTGLIGHLSGAQYRGRLGHFHPGPSHDGFLRLYVFPPLFAMIALLGVTARGAREAVQRRILLGLFAVVAFQTLFGLLYNVPDPASYFIPPLALALTALPPLAASLIAIAPRLRPVATWAGVALALLAVGQLGPQLKIGIGRRNLLVAIDRKVHDQWVSIPVEKGIVLWGDDFQNRFNEYQLLGGERPGLHVISPWDMTVPLTRARFLSRYGFDPFGSLSTTPGRVVPPAVSGPAYRAYLEVFARQLHEATHQPVVVLKSTFDSVRVVDDASGLAPDAVARNGVDSRR